MELLILNGLVNGLIVGGIYALVGVSLTLLYGVLRVVNFAHGEFVIAGSFLAFVLFSSFGVPPLLPCRSPPSPSSPPAGASTTC